MLRVEIAWRLQDSKKMKEAMVAYAAPSVLSKKEEAYAFMASGQVGQADLFLRLGKDIEARGGLGGFHQKALEDISFFDFAAMYKALVGGQPVSLVGDIQDQGYSVRHIKVRVGSTYGSSDQARALVNLIRSQASDEWRDRPDSPISLVRIGQSVHWAEAPSSPPYTGFMSSDRLFMEGYLENDTPGDAGTQVQTFDMKREVGASNHWSGNNTIQAFTPDKAGKPKEVLRVVLNYQWDLVPE